MDARNRPPLEPEPEPGPRPERSVVEPARSATVLFHRTYPLREIRDPRTSPWKTLPAVRKYSQTGVNESPNQLVRSRTEYAGNFVPSFRFDRGFVIGRSSPGTPETRCRCPGTRGRARRNTRTGREPERSWPSTLRGTRKNLANGETSSDVGPPDETGPDTLVADPLRVPVTKPRAHPGREGVGPAAASNREAETGNFRSTGPHRT